MLNIRVFIWNVSLCLLTYLLEQIKPSMSPFWLVSVLKSTKLSLRKVVASLVCVINETLAANVMIDRFLWTAQYHFVAWSLYLNQCNSCCNFITVLLALCLLFGETLSAAVFISHCLWTSQCNCFDWSTSCNCFNTFCHCVTLLISLCIVIN